MPTKFRKLTTKNNAVRKKMHNSVRVRASRVLSRVRKLICPPASLPLCITISTEGLTQEQTDLLKEMEAKGLIPKITWIESRPSGLEDKLKYALLYFHSEEAKSLGCKILKGYDYAWVKIAMDSNKMPNRYGNYQFMSTPKFVEFIKSLGFSDIAGAKTLNKLMAHARWNSDDNIINFHRVHISISERKRRNLIAKMFLEIMNEM